MKGGTPVDKDAPFLACHSFFHWSDNHVYKDDTLSSAG